MGIKYSKVWQVDPVLFESLVKSSSSYKEVFTRLDMPYSAGNYRTLHNRIKESNIDVSHIIEANKNRTKLLYLINKNTIPLEQILVEDSPITGRTSALKRKLLKKGLLENKCSKCGMTAEWQGEFISLQLDHINGVNNDNRIENLRILCPNCHSQTNTYAGKTNRKIKSFVCPRCLNKKKSKISKLCRSCGNKHSIKRASKNLGDLDLVKEYVDNFGFRAAGEKFGLSDTGIKKRLKKAGYINFNKYPKFPNNKNISLGGEIGKTQCAATTSYAGSSPVPSSNTSL